MSSWKLKPISLDQIENNAVQWYSATNVSNHFQLPYFLKEYLGIFYDIFRWGKYCKIFKIYVLSLTVLKQQASGNELRAAIDVGQKKYRPKQLK